MAGGSKTNAATAAGFASRQWMDLSALGIFGFFPPEIW
jgi:hypothetical protein